MTADDPDPSDRVLFVDAVAVRRLRRDGEATGTLFEDADGERVSESIEIVNTSASGSRTWRQAAWLVSKIALAGAGTLLAVALLVALVSAPGDAGYEPQIGTSDATAWSFAVAAVLFVVLVNLANRYAPGGRWWQR